VIHNAIGHLPCVPRTLLSRDDDLHYIASGWQLKYAKSATHADLIAASQHVIILYSFAAPFILYDLIATAMKYGTRWTVYYVF
jgi:hypothetical protein